MRLPFVVRAFVGCSLIVSPALAQEAPLVALPGQIVAISELESSVTAAAAQSRAGTLRAELPVEKRRPRAVVPLYASLIALNALDVHSTLRGLSTGETREANPVMTRVVEHHGAFLAVKAGVTLGTIWMTEKARKKHPKLAVAALVICNAAVAAVVANNYQMARR